MCPTLFIYLFFSTFSLMLFYPKLLWVHARGGGCALVDMATGAQKWRAVGQKVTHSWQKSDVRRADKWRTGQNATWECFNGYQHTSHHGFRSQRASGTDSVSMSWRHEVEANMNIKDWPHGLIHRMIFLFYHYILNSVLYYYQVLLY